MSTNVLPFKDKILVICNSRHHSKNIIHFAEKLAERSDSGRVFGVCEKSELSYYKNHCNNKFTEFIVFEKSKQPSSDFSEKSQKFYKNSYNYFSSIYRKFAEFEAKTKSKTFFWLIKFLKNSSIGFVIRTIFVKENYKKQKLIADSILNDIKPNLILSFADRHVDFELSILVSAKQYNIDIMLPYCTFSSSTGLITVRKLNPGLEKWSPLSFFRIVMNIILKEQTKAGYYWQQPHVLLALKILGFLNPNPWVIGAGNSDFVCVDNITTYNRYLNEGVHKEKIKLVGDLNFDKLFESNKRKQEIKFEFEAAGIINPNKKTIILALPQFAEQGIFSWEKHWEENNYILTQLSQLNTNFIVSLHPRMNPNDYKSLSKKFNVHLSQKPLVDVLPIADLFISINSNTAFWANICGIKSIILDYFPTDCSMFENFENFYFIREKRLLGNFAEHILKSPSGNFEKDWEKLSKKEVFDGKVLKRYQNLVGV